MATAPRIGTIIRRARERKLMSQEELAGKLRVSRSAVNSWERDRSYPRNRLGAIEEVLGISLTGEPAPEPADEWERWERSVLTDPNIPAETARAIVTDANAARDAYFAAAGSGPAAPSSPAAPSAGARARHRAAG